MKAFKINNVSYKIPTSWWDLNLETFLKIKKHESKVEKLSTLDYNLEFVSIVTGIPKIELGSLIPSEYSAILAELLVITSADIQPIVEPIINLNGQIYVMDRESDKMPIAQFIDLDIINKTGDVWENAHKICASFIRKVDIGIWRNAYLNGKKKCGGKLVCGDYKAKKYSWKELEKDADIFLTKMPMPFIYTTMIFFLTINKLLENPMNLSSLNEMKGK